MKHAFLAVIALIVISWIGSLVGLDYLFGVVFPYLAFAVFLGGFIYRVTNWAKSPVPFRVPTTSGQGKSLDWVKQDKLDCPATFWQVVGRMASWLGQKAVRAGHSTGGSRSSPDLMPRTRFRCQNHSSRIRTRST